VRQLAQRTNEATSQIESMIAEVQSETVNSKPPKQPQSNEKAVNSLNQLATELKEEVSYFKVD